MGALYQFGAGCCLLTWAVVMWTEILVASTTIIGNRQAPMTERGRLRLRLVACITGEIGVGVGDLGLSWSLKRYRPFDDGFVPRSSRATANLDSLTKRTRRKPFIGDLNVVRCQINGCWMKTKHATKLVRQVRKDIEGDEFLAKSISKLPGTFE